MSKISLNDKFEAEHGHVFISGIQALVRLPIVQRKRDIAAGLKTAGFISGYRGSPLGGYDQALMRAGKYLDEFDIHFEPGVNEDLAATAVWGTQQLNLTDKARYDGVFGLWYGKGPGLDRSMDVMKHGNAAGTSPHGGVLCITGDDHGCKSSTLPHQCDHSYMAALMPVLFPSGIHEFVEYGLLGIAMSRFSGCWVGFKAVAEAAEASGTIDLEREWREIVTPEFDFPPGGPHIRWPDVWREQDHRLQRYKGFAALEFARANKIDRLVWDSPNPRIGIMASGKAYADVRQALYELGITEEIARDIGLRLYKVGMPWPLEPEGARAFAEGLEEVLVVEEKREMVEHQLKWQLFNWKENVRPRVVGKHDENNNWLLPAENELSVGQVAQVIAQRLAKHLDSKDIRDKLAYFDRRAERIGSYESPIARTPYFCSGCPHNSSTKVPEGSRAFAGIGCHIMAINMDRDTETYTHMGGEGVTWVGQAPFTDENHVFVNLGDGTYQHSGLLAIRAAVAAGVNVTYKILYNDAVAMTGGQPVEGGLTVEQIAAQVKAEGVGRVVILSEQPERFAGADLPPDVDVFDRRELDPIQRELRETPGATALIYDQTCAAEKRRRRKRGLLDDPPIRPFINAAVCEGCGDCSVQSNCISVEPLETEFGRKRMINQSSCNKDMSCVRGFCPSFVTVHGGQVRKSKLAGGGAESMDLFPPEPKTPEMVDHYNILVTGIGGTGVLTVGSLLGMAAHVEGKQSLLADMTGLAQKGGAVLSYVRIGKTRDTLQSSRIISGGGDLLLACDSVVASGQEAINILNAERTAAVINTKLSPVAAFVRDKNLDFRDHAVLAAVRDATRTDATHLVNATEIATAVMGDAIASNVFMLGYAYQKGLVPLKRESIEEAIRLNGVAVESNLEAFLWGRRAGHDLEAVAQLLEQSRKPTEPIATALDEIIAKRVAHLTGYQNADYAKRYTALVERVRSTESALGGGLALTEAVARNYAKLLAYKDEYEVARLYTDGNFRARLDAQFAGSFKLKVHLAPPLLSRTDPTTGRPKKREFGAWVLTAMKPLAAMKGLRGTAFDIFGYSAERRAERQLIADYEELINDILGRLTAENRGVAAELAGLPDMIRGFGPIKEANIAAAKTKEAELRAAFDNPAPDPKLETAA